MFNEEIRFLWVPLFTVAFVIYITVPTDVCNLYFSNQIRSNGSFSKKYKVMFWIAFWIPSFRTETTSKFTSSSPYVALLIGMSSMPLPPPVSGPLLNTSSHAMNVHDFSTYVLVHVVCVIDSVAVVWHLQFNAGFEVERNHYTETSFGYLRCPNDRISQDTLFARIIEPKP